MAGTVDGGRKAALKNKTKDPDFYKKIGHIGGMAGDNSVKGWAHPDRQPYAVENGRKGGSAARHHTDPKDRTIKCPWCERKYVTMASLRSHTSKDHRWEKEEARSLQTGQRISFSAAEPTRNDA